MGRSRTCLLCRKKTLRQYEPAELYSAQAAPYTHSLILGSGSGSAQLSAQQKRRITERNKNLCTSSNIPVPALALVC